MGDRTCLSLATQEDRLVDAIADGLIEREAAERKSAKIKSRRLAADFERARPSLEVIGSQIALCGPIGSGQVVKAANQLIVVATLGAVGEALAVLRAAGVDPWVARDLMLAGYAGSPVLDSGGGRMIRRDFAPGGKAAYNLKDIAALAELSAASGVRMLVFDAAANYVKATCRHRWWRPRPLRNT